MPESGIRQLGDTGDHEDWQGLYRCNHRTDPPDRRLPRERIIQQLRSNGIDLERGVSTHHEDEARLNRCMCQVAERIIVVTDSSKFGRRSLHKIIDTPRIHTLITDDAVPADILSGLHNAGIEVMLVPAG